MTANPHLIRAEPFVEIGAILQRESELLTNRWAVRAVQEQPQAGRVHHDVLLDHLPGFLWEVGRHLAEEGDGGGAIRRPAALHGVQRWEAGWSLAEVVRDYGILRRIVLEHLDAALARPLRLLESQAIGLAFDDAIEASVEQFVRSRDEQLRQTQQAHADQSQKAEEELLRWKKVFLDASWGIVVGHPLEHSLLAVNPAFARMHGCTVEEAMGRPAEALLAPDLQATLPELLKPAFEKGHHTYETFHVRKDGSRFPVQVDVTVYRDGAGRLLYWAANVQDISERRRMEDSLRERTEALQDADRRKNEFLATLAHELRNPLAALRSSLEVVRLVGNSPEVFRQAREVMDRQGEQMTRLVEDLLDVTRIGQGKLVLRRDRLDLRLIVQQAVQMNEPLVKARGHQLTVALPADPMWVDGDQARLVQIVVNLLNNAARYTPDHGQIRLSAEREENEFTVRVKDNGIGIPPEKLSRVFDLFAQLDADPDQTQNGLGIGLTLVRRLVELHGGSVTATSLGSGRGSEFVVRLPVAAAEPGEAPPPVVEQKPTLSRHVLIVEDNQDARETLGVLLRLLGHRVDLAADGPRGVEAALSLRPDIALVDIGLPILDGCEVARQIRTGLKDTVFLIALTGYSQPEDRQQAAEAGFDAFLTKPVELAPLQDLLTRSRSLQD